MVVGPQQRNGDGNKERTDETASTRPSGQAFDLPLELLEASLDSTGMDFAEADRIIEVAKT